MRILAVNERGIRIGEDHQNAVLSNHDVELLLVMRGEGLGYKRLAKAFEISKAQVRRICAGKQRCQLSVVFRVPVPAAERVKVAA